VSTLAILCARANPGRLPAKHHLEIDGLPVWHFGARAVLQSRAIPAVSTDDSKILADAVEMGLFPVRRPKRLASSTASIHGALQHAVREYETDAQCPGRVKLVAFVPANVPTVTGRVLRRCFSALRRSPGATAVMTVREVSEHPGWMWKRAKSGALSRFGRESVYRMQDLPKLYIATGTCAIVRRDVLMACTDGRAFKWLGSRILGVLDPDACEIHTQRDYLMAKAMVEDQA